MKMCVDKEWFEDYKATYVMLDWDWRRNRFLIDYDDESLEKREG